MIYRLAEGNATRSARYLRLMAAVRACAAVIPAAAAGDARPLETSAPTVVGRWQFAPPHVAGTTVANLAGGPPGTLARPAAEVAVGTTAALRFDGGANAVTIGTADDARWAAGGFTALAWVRVDELRRWSRFVGVVARQQDRRLGSAGCSAPTTTGSCSPSAPQGPRGR